MFIYIVLSHIYYLVLIFRILLISIIIYYFCYWLCHIPISLFTVRT